jgi:hypothetical protein
VHGTIGCAWCECQLSHARLMADGIRQGEQLRDEGISLVLDAPPSAEWLDAARAWVQALEVGRLFTSTDLVDSIGLPPSPRAVGAVIRASSVGGLIGKTGTYVQSARPQRHAGTIAQWRRL